MQSRNSATNHDSSEYPADFILHLQKRLNLNRREARTLLAAWVQEFAPAQRLQHERLQHERLQRDGVDKAVDPHSSAGAGERLFG